MHWKMVGIFVVMVACLCVVIAQIDLDTATRALAETEWWTFGPVFVCYLMAHALRTLRLGVLLDSSVPFTKLFAINSVGFLAINVVPLRLGELVRPAMLYERHQVPFGSAMAAIVMERLLDMLMLLFMLLGLTWWVELPQDGLVVQGIDVVGAGQRIAGTIVALGILFAASLMFFGDAVILLLSKIPVVGRFSGFAERFRDGMKSLLSSPLRLLLVAFHTVGLWTLTMVGIRAFMWGFPGIPSSVGAVWTTWSITLSGMTAIPTPGFFGGYELFCTAALWLFNVPAELAGTFAITLHLGQFAFTCGLGGFFLLKEGLGWKNLVVKRSDIDGA